MRSTLSTVVAAVAATTIALAPAAAASAATVVKAAPTYTLHVSGNGGRAAIGWTAMTVSKNGTPSNPQTGTNLSAHEPWTKHVSAKANIVEVFATQKAGTRISCTIVGPTGKVLSHSTAYGKGGIVTCIVSKTDLLSGLSGM